MWYNDSGTGDIHATAGWLGVTQMADDSGPPNDTTTLDLKA